MCRGTTYKPLYFISLLKGSKSIPSLLHRFTAASEMLWDLRSATILSYNQKHAVQHGTAALKRVFAVRLLMCDISKRTHGFQQILLVVLGGTPATLPANTS